MTSVRRTSGSRRLIGGVAVVVVGLTRFVLIVAVGVVPQTITSGLPTVLIIRTIWFTVDLETSL